MIYNSYPLAIGTMALPTSEIRPRSGMKGKAVHVIHVYEDYLWSMGDKSTPPEFEGVSDDEYEEEEEAEDKDNRNQTDIVNTTEELPEKTQLTTSGNN